MAFWKTTTAGLRRLFTPRRADRDLDDELQAFIAAATDDYIARGLTPAAAARQAAVDVGSRAAVKDEVREGGWEHLVDVTRRDATLAIRSLRRTPGFTIVAALTLALGIGAATTIFGAVDPILWRTLPYPAADSLVVISDRGDGGVHAPVTYGTFREVAARIRAFEAVSATDGWQPVLGDITEPVRIDGQRVTSAYFRTLGVSPARGRDFVADDERTDAPRVAILSDAAVLRRFGGNMDVLGRTITLSGAPYLVVGIMPRGFATTLAPAAEIWTPVRYQWPATFQGPEWGHHMTMVARLRRGISVGMARAEADTVARTTSRDFVRPPWANLSRGLVVSPLQEEATRDIRPALVAIFGAALLVLVVAAVNVTNLLVGRSATRRGEFAMRAALGANRGRLVRQVLTETVVLTTIGGALGLAAAVAGVRGLALLGPPGWRPLDDLHVDTASFVFSVGASLLVGIGIGVMPSIDAARGAATGLLRASRRMTTGRPGARNTLVIAEVALALVLLAGAGLLWRSVSGLLAIAPGFDPSHVLSLRLQVTGGPLNDDGPRRQRLLEIADAIRRVPGVISVGLTSQLPLSGDFDAYGASFATVPDTSPEGDGAALRYLVAGDYFAAMKIPLIRGRLLNNGDRSGAPEAILVSESYARRKFAGVNPIGQQVKFGPEISDKTRPWGTVVGVVGDVKQASLGLTPEDAFYTAIGQWPWMDATMSFVIRTSGDAAALAPAVTQAIHVVDPARAVERLQPMTTLVMSSEAERIFVMRLFEAFALATVLLAAIGIYGVLAGSVTERTREIGVRTALGATRRQVLALVAHQAIVLTVAGLTIGVGGALISSRLIATFLFGVTRFDPWTYGGVALLVGAVSGIACIVPAWRAARVDPVRALRAE